MSTNQVTLPADPEKEGNVWCESCSKSLTAARAAAHLASKSHLANADAFADTDEPDEPDPQPKVVKASKTAAPKGRSTKKPAKAEEEPEREEVPAERKKPARKAAEKTAEKKEGPKGTAARAHALPRDPNKDGNFWCGICEVSLTPSKADGHLDTARHMSNEDKTLATAVNRVKIGAGRGV